MPLRVLHRILITAAIALALLFAARAVVLFAREREAADLALAGASAVVAAGLAVYLRRARAQWAKEGPAPPKGRV